ncbi:MAG: methionyl-tRNA formyltransferase [Hyphomicrobiales bacterium]|nr:methionyl-tRNA formyltransferase [Hyphomicrobiales bacterium]
MSLRIIFMGTPEYSVPTLSALIEAGHEIVGVYSQPPRPGGRGMDAQKSSVHQFAEQVGISVYCPVSLKGEMEQAEFAALNADIAIVVAYGLILPRPILDAPRLGCFNGHASLLPRWRGAAPIQRAIEAGDKQSGVMIMQMEAGLDTGPVLMSEKVSIPDHMTAGELHDVLSALTATLMVQAITKLETGAVKLVPQNDEGLVYAKKLEKSEARINWNKSAQQVHDHIRAMSPFPGAWCELVLGGKPTRVKILSALPASGEGKPGQVLDQQLTIACANGAIRPVRLQKAGKLAGDLSQFLLGNNVEVGTVIA